MTKGFTVEGTPVCGTGTDGGDNALPSEWAYVKFLTKSGRVERWVMDESLQTNWKWFGFNSEYVCPLPPEAAPVIVSAAGC